jgi:hypothetical protein
VTGGQSRDIQLIGSVLVRNEDVFVERAIRNTAAVCDRIHVLDHLSTDTTWSIIRSLASELANLDVRRTRNSADAHRVLERYAGTPTWVLGVDGDELFDPAGLQELRAALRAGTHSDVFRLKAHVLNCDEVDLRQGVAYGYMAPPSRPVTKLFNFAAVDSWRGCLDPLQGGEITFRAGFHWESRRDVADSTSWETDPLRCLHVCFVRRSTLELADEVGWRKNLDETRAFRQGFSGRVIGALRRPTRSPGADRVAQLGSTWKREWYMRGERLAVDATPFFGAASALRSPEGASSATARRG